MNGQTTYPRRAAGSQLFMVLVMLGLILAYTADAEAGEKDWSDRADDRAELSLVVETGEDEHRSLYLLLEDFPEDDWFDDEPEFIGFDGARTTVDDRRLPDSFSSWRDDEIRIVDADGATCRTEVSGLYGLVRHSTSPIKQARWEGRHPDRKESLTPGEIARKIWDPAGIRSRDVVLAAELEDAGGNCDIDQPRWGHQLDRDVARLEPTRLTDHQTEELLFEFRDTDDYHSIQKRFEEYSPETDGTWTTRDRYTPEIAAFFSRQHNRTFAVVRADAGPGCGGFGGRTWELFELDYSGSDLRIDRLETNATHPGAIIAMVDPGLEGRPVLVTETKSYNTAGGQQLVEWNDGGFNSSFTARVSTEFGCPC